MSNLLGPRDANGIPVPMTVDESIASMKASLLKKSNVLPTFTAWTAVAATAAKSKFSPRFRRCLMQNASALKSFLHRVMRIFYCLPARSPVQCDPPALRAWQSAPDPKICISYGACGNSGGIFHDLYCVWGGTDKIVPVDVYILAARQRLPLRYTALQWRSACWSRKFTPVGRVSRMNNRRRSCMAIWCSRCV